MGCPLSADAEIEVREALEMADEHQLSAVSEHLIAMSRQIGELTIELRGLRRDLDESNLRAAEGREALRLSVEGMKARVKTLEREVEKIKEDQASAHQKIVRAMEFVDRAAVRSAERRGAAQAIKMIWHGTTWTGRAFGALVVAAIFYLGDSIVETIRRALQAFINGPPGH